MLPPEGYRSGHRRRLKHCPPATPHPTVPTVVTAICWGAVRIAMEEGATRAEIAAAMQEVAAEVEHPT